MTNGAESKINDLRRRILENQAKGLPLAEGIPDEELREALETLRLRRSSISESLASKKRRGASVAMPEGPVESIDFGALFKKARESGAVKSAPPVQSKEGELPK